MKHPAEAFIKYLLIREPGITDAIILKTLADWSILAPIREEREVYIGFLRQDIDPPEGFNAADRTHRPSMQFLRRQGVYELFFATPAVEEAWDILAHPEKRQVVEQILMARLHLNQAALKVNKTKNWHLSAAGIEKYKQFFWNVDLLSFDEWGKFLYERSSMYDRHIALLRAPPELAYFHLRVEQQLEAKEMIKRGMEIAYYNLEEVNLQPGTKSDKIKAIAMLNKTLVDSHAALSTSDMALKEVLKEFERFRMVHTQVSPPDIRKLAPAGNYSGSGADGANVIPIPVAPKKG